MSAENASTVTGKTDQVNQNSMVRHNTHCIYQHHYHRRSQPCSSRHIPSMAGLNATILCISSRPQRTPS